MTEYAKTVFDCLYDCKMTVKGYTEQEIDGLTSMSESVLLEDIPCRISQMSNSSTNGSDYQANGYDMKLFCSVAYDIPAGCKIEVTDRNGHVKVFTRSNVPIGQYWSHQEIAIKLEGKS